MLGDDLAAARAGQQTDARFARGDRLDERVGAIGGRVRGDEDRELLGRIVEREQVLEPPLDHRLLVVGRDDHGHLRLVRAVGVDRPWTDTRDRGHRGRVTDVCPGKRAERAPEERLQTDARPGRYRVPAS